MHVPTATMMDSESEDDEGESTRDQQPALSAMPATRLGSWPGPNSDAGDRDGSCRVGCALHCDNQTAIRERERERERERIWKIVIRPL